MRVAAFVSGGLIPEHLRGTSNNMRFHIVDWCECSKPAWAATVATTLTLRTDPTFCYLAGIDGSDDSPTPPKPIDPALGLDQDVRPALLAPVYAVSHTGVSLSDLGRGRMAECRRRQHL